jgi:hypothetical protein
MPSPRAVGLALLLAPGCVLANMTPQARFSENAHTLTEAARWGHVDMAMPLIAPKYSATYLSRHREWGGQVTIADAELVRVQLAEDHDTAMSEVNFSWYTNGGVTLRQSTVTQKWEAEGGAFQLVDEQVRAGDPNLLAAAAEPEKPEKPEG